MLRRQVERLGRRGFVAKAGSELEYYQFRTSYEEAARSGYRGLRETGWYIEDYQLLQGARTEDINGAFRRHLAASGVPVESTKGEFGRGQHELNIRYAPVLEMADRHLVLKQAVKEISDQLGCSATFMAKPGRRPGRLELPPSREPVDGRERRAGERVRRRRRRSPASPVQTSFAGSWAGGCGTRQS